MFFIDAVAVTPTRFRPAVEMGDVVFEDPHNELLTKILITSYRLRDLNNQLNVKDKEIDQTKLLGTLLESLILLQDHVNSFIDYVVRNTSPVSNSPPAAIFEPAQSITVSQINSR